jgi:2-polyprenyl-3-methyl-5-hydroxy-6-metoxy-1,4-benzoquinol methylase
MSTEKRDFDKDAAKWDENPGRLKMAEAVFNTINSNLKLTKSMRILDFGCGTGLLSLRLLPLVNSVTGADSSRGMLDVLNSKIADQNLQNIKTLLIDIDKDEHLTGEYDVVTSSMTMHHIKNPVQLLKQFHSILTPGGFLCIADLDSDEGKFHEDNTGVFHMGFHRDEMKSFFAEAGFKDITGFTAAEISKPGKDGSVNKFSVFLIAGRKV